MRPPLIFALLLSACASAPATRPAAPAVAAASAPAKPALRVKIGLSDGWKRRPVTVRHREKGLLAAYINPATQSRLFVWNDAGAMTPQDLAEGLVNVTVRSHGTARPVAVPKPDAAVVYVEKASGRGGYSVFRRAPDGSTVTFDADFPPAHADAVITEITSVARDAFSE